MRIAVRGEGGVTDEGRVVDAANFHSWSKYATPLTQIGCQMLPLACTLTFLYYLHYYTIYNIFYYVCPLFCFLGCHLFHITWILYLASWGVI